MRWIILVLVLMVFGFGCLFQPYSEDVNLTKKTGCAYNEPPCDENYSCINNTCLLKQGCAYSNPACGENETCTNNVCTQRPGCDFSNPPCEEDYDCIDNKCIEQVICGKFGCQAGESETCCQDCSCPAGEACDKSGVCLVNGTELEISNLTIASIPSTILYAVPSKTVEKALGPLAQFTVKNRGTNKAYSVKVRSEVQGFSGTIQHELGTINPREEVKFNLTQRLNDNVLDLSNRTTTKLKIFLEYKGLGESFTKTSGANFWLPGRNAFDWAIPEAAASWIDPYDEPIAAFAKDATDYADIKVDEDRERAARQVYNHMQAFGMQLSPGECYSDSLAFPAETLKAKAGDCAELSVLYAALLEAVKVKSVLIKTQDSVLSGYMKSDGTVVPVDLQEIDEDDFATALQNGMIGYDKSAVLVIPQEKWGTGTEQVSLGIDVPGPRIISSSQNCVLLENEFDVRYWFENIGYDTGRRCLRAVLYEGQGTYFSQRECVDIPGFEKRSVTFSIDVPKNKVVTEKCWVD